MVLAAVLAANPSLCRAQSPFDPLLKQVSAEANVLVLVDAERMRRSEFARDIAEADRDDSASAHVVPRSELSLVVLAAHIRGFRESMIDWQTALLQLNTEPSVAGVAATYGGSIEEIGKTEYAVLPYGAVAVATGKNVLAVLTPPDRQQVARLVRQATATKSTPLQGYLASAASSAGSDAIIAIDLEGMFARSQIRAGVESSDTFRERRDQRETAVGVLSTIRGLTVRVQLRKQPRAELTVDFSQPIPDLSSWGKDLLKEILSNNGAWIDDIDGWSAQQEDRKVVIGGPISLSGLRQLFSLLDFPTEVPAEYRPGAQLSPEKERQLAAKASLSRFRACEKLVADLKKDNRARTSRIGESALWFDRYARKIETLPSLHVDPAVLEYCDDVVLRLRIQATRYRMGSLNITAQATTPNVFWGYFNNFYGNTYAVSTLTESDADRTRRYERSATAGDRADQFQAIAEAGTKVRREMTAKYKVEF